MSEAGSIAVSFKGALGRFHLDATFEVPARGVIGLFGPSGCGKTTVLRCIAGLTRLPGRCAVNGAVWQDGPVFRLPHQRPIGYVFQEASLFPHLSVERNLLYGAVGSGPLLALREQDALTPRSVRSSVGFAEVVDLLGLASLLDRAPRHLSGGERQRVAIGRALLSRPKLLLMDEPLSALDRASRDEILPFLERLHATLAVPVFYVSHDMAEIDRLADTLVLMKAGRVVAAGPLPDLQSDPALPLAAARDAAVSLDARVADYDAEYVLATLRIDGAHLIVPGVGSPPGSHHRVRIAAGDVSLSRTLVADTTILNWLPVRIEAVKPADSRQMIVVLRTARGEGAKLLARVTHQSWDRLAFEPGQDVYALVKSVSLAPTSRLA